MRILLTGRNGQVGWELERALPALGELIATDRTTLDVADADAIRRVVRDVKPDLIVNAAAYTAVDRAESEPELAKKINGIAPGVLAEEAKRLGALLVHYSTDYVFDGAKREPYVETDQTGPLNVYGRTKLEGELAVQATAARHLILRTSWIYGSRGRNFLAAIIAKARAGEVLRVVDDQTGAPTWCREIASATVELAQALQQGRSSEEGIFHMSASGQTTWYGFAREILDRIASAMRLTPIATSEFPAAARRPAWSVLNCVKVRRSFALELVDWRAALQRCLGDRF